jgi:hypothetical protein
MMDGLSRVALVGLFLWGLWTGLRQQDHVLTWGSLFVLLALVWGAATVAFTALVLRRAMAASPHPRRIEGSTEEPALTGWHCPLAPWVPLREFSSTLNGSPTRFVRQGGRLSEMARFPRRRLQEGLQREFVIKDALGITSWSFRDQRAQGIRILPIVDSSRGLAPMISVVSGADLPDPYAAETGDRLDMRRYRKGDPLRLVLWTIYQRSGHLMVRAPEKAVSQHQRTGLYLLTDPEDFPAAKLARVLLEKDALGPNWRFGADGRLGWANDLEAALDLLADSGQSDSPVRLHSFLQDLARDRFGKCLLLAGNDPEKLERELANLTQAQLPHLDLEIWVVFDHPSALRDPEQSGGRLAGVPPGPPARNTFPKVAGVDMHLVERRGPDFRLVPW